MISIGFLSLIYNRRIHKLSNFMMIFPNCRHWHIPPGCRSNITILYLPCSQPAFCDEYFGGLMQKSRNSGALAMELLLFCIKPLIVQLYTNICWCLVKIFSRYMAKLEDKWLTRLMKNTLDTHKYLTEYKMNAWECVIYYAINIFKCMALVPWKLKRC